MRFRFSGIPLVCPADRACCCGDCRSLGTSAASQQNAVLPTGHKILARALPLRPGKALIHAGQAGHSGELAPSGLPPPSHAPAAVLHAPASSATDGAARRGAAPPQYLLVIDQGSSSSKCFIFDQDLYPVVRVEQPVRSSFPSTGLVEHDPDELLNSVLDAVRAAVAGLGAPGKRSPRSASRATETFVVWDKQTGAAAYPGVRARHRAEELWQPTCSDEGSPTKYGPEPACPCRPHSQRRSSTCSWAPTPICGPASARGSAGRGREQLADLADDFGASPRHRCINGVADDAVQPS